MKQLILRSPAEQEVTEALEWYAARSPDLAAEFLLALDETLQLVRQEPETFPLVRPPLRRALLTRFPYAVYYRDYPDLVSVVAVIHGKRPHVTGNRAREG